MALEKIILSKEEAENRRTDPDWVYPLSGLADAVKKEIKRRANEIRCAAYVEYLNESLNFFELKKK